MSAGHSFIDWLILPFSTRTSPEWFGRWFLGCAKVTPLVFHNDSKGIVQKQTIVAPKSLLDGITENFRPTIVGPVDAYFPKDAFLIRPIEVPKKLRRKTNDIAKLDILASTPFMEGEFLWVVDFHSSKGPLLMGEIWIIKTQVVRTALASLEKLGLQTRKVFIEGKATVPLIDSGEVSNNKKTTWSLSLLLAVGLIVCGLLAPKLIALVTAQRENQQLVKIAEQLRTDTLSKRVALDQTNTAFQNQRDFLDRTQFKQPVSQTLRELTIAIPDSAWLSSISITNNVLIASGSVDGSAAEHVLELSKKDGFALVELRGAISRSGANRENFELILPLENGGLAK